MSTLNASGATIGLDYQSTFMVPGDVINQSGDQTIKDGDGSTHFTEIFFSGWRQDYFGTFSNYAPDDNKSEYPQNAIINSITSSHQGNPFFEWSGLMGNPTQEFDNGIDINRLFLSGSDSIIGSIVADRLAGFAGNDNIDGGTGTDTAAYFSNRANYSLSKTANGWSVSGGNDGSDTLTNVERLQFSDKKVALDLTTDGNAAKSLEFIGVMAHGLVSNVKVVGTILSIFDQGKSMQEVCQLAIDVGLTRDLAGSTSNLDLAKLAFRNVIGSEADEGTANALAGYIQGSGGSMSQAEFLATVAQLDLNNQHIGLVGLQQTGVEYATQ